MMAVSTLPSVVRFELSPFSDILVNLTVWDPNLKVFSGKFLKPQGLGTSAGGRSDYIITHNLTGQYSVNIYAG